VEFWQETNTLRIVAGSRSAARAAALATSSASATVSVARRRSAGGSIEGAGRFTGVASGSAMP